MAEDGHLTWVFLGCQRSPLQRMSTISLFLFQERRGYHRDRTGEGIRHPAGQSDCCAEGWGTGSLRVRLAGAVPFTPVSRGTRGPRVAEGGSAGSRGSRELPFSFQHHLKSHGLERSESHGRQAPREVTGSAALHNAIGVGLILPGAGSRRSEGTGTWQEMAGAWQARALRQEQAAYLCRVQRLSVASFTWVRLKSWL